MSSVMKQCISCSIPAKNIYSQLLDEQLQFFQHYDGRIHALGKGTKIRKDFYTKTNHKAVPGTMQISGLQENRLFELTTRYQNNEIVQRFVIDEENGVTSLCYEEENIFADRAKSLNFSLVSLVYRFAFKRQAKKRLRYLCAQAEAI